MEGSEHGMITSPDGGKQCPQEANEQQKKDGASERIGMDAKRRDIEKTKKEKARGQLLLPETRQLQQRPTQQALGDGVQLPTGGFLPKSGQA